MFFSACIFSLSLHIMSAIFTQPPVRVTLKLNPQSTLTFMLNGTLICPPKQQYTDNSELILGHFALIECGVVD